MLSFVGRDDSRITGFVAWEIDLANGYVVGEPLFYSVQAILNVWDRILWYIRQG
ncbi:hypothetical protein TPY_1282 [Sulfobacillus acidophilus TPY]|nr:hypothetical protein TPY_1282 [Sulfobacillus acidophilus TPY]